MLAWTASTWMAAVTPVVVTAGGVLAYGFANPRSRIMGPLTWRAAPSRDGHAKRIALTFDDGPNPSWTPGILDTLNSTGTPGAFFVIGAHAQRHPALLRRIVAEGHLIANHSYDHARHGLWRHGRYWRDQITRTDELILRLAGVRPSLFRPPFGFKHFFQMSAARRCGHTVVTWSRRAMDSGPRPTAGRIVDRLAHVDDGDIILLHDGHEPGRPHRRAATVDAIGSLIAHWRASNVQVTPLNELLHIKPYQ